MERIGTRRIETDRLILRPIESEDAEAMWEWTSDENVARYCCWQVHTDKAQTRGYCAYCVKGYEDPGVFRWGIIWKESGELCGCIDGVYYDPVSDCEEIGYCLMRRFWRRGIMSEALRAVMRYLFEEANVYRLEARHNVDNPASGRVMDKAGLRYEGILRGTGIDNQGRHVDMAVYGLLRGDWEEGKAGTRA